MAPLLGHLTSQPPESSRRPEGNGNDERLIVLARRLMSSDQLSLLIATFPTLERSLARPDLERCGSYSVPFASAGERGPSTSRLGKGRA